MDSVRISSTTDNINELLLRPKSHHQGTAMVDTTETAEEVIVSSGDGPMVSGGGSGSQRQPLVPVQSSKKRKRDRPSLDYDEVDDAHHNNENKKPRIGVEDLDEIVLSSDDDTALPIASPPSIDSVLSPWDGVREVDEPPVALLQKTPHSNRRKKNASTSEATTTATAAAASSSTTTSDVKGPVACYVSPSSELRPCPLPQLSWADPRGVWKTMCRRDGRNLLDRHPNMLDKHPGILKKMRAILLDWLIEVCEVYKLHRETYHLAMDYLDRYLSRTQETCKTQLQLIGITCLFIAAKMEEIYPPKIAEFAYVTDSACDEADIQMQELGILQVLEWKVNTITAIGWLGIYLQVDVTHRRDFNAPSTTMTSGGRMPSSVSVGYLETPDKSPKGADEFGGDEDEKTATSTAATKPRVIVTGAFEFPQFSGYEFTQVAQLMDLCSLDVDITNFPYSVVAAAAIYHVRDRRTALAVSGLTWESIADCVQWMEPFHAVILEDGAPLQLLEQNEHVAANYGLHSVCPNLTKDDSYKIQVHTCNLDMFDKVMKCREEAASSNTVNLLSPGGMLTPPASSRKSMDQCASSAVSEQKPT